VCEWGTCGLKLYPTYNCFYPNDNMVYPVYVAAERLQIPVMVDTGSSVFAGSRLKYGDPVYLDDMAVDFLRPSQLITYGGRPFWYDQAMALATLHPNVYVEVGCRLSACPPTTAEVTTSWPFEPCLLATQPRSPSLAAMPPACWGWTARTERIRNGAK